MAKIAEAILLRAIPRVAHNRGQIHDVETGELELAWKDGRVRMAAQRLRADGAAQLKILTSCPSCLQGLKRYNDDADLDADYMVVEIARHIVGESWMADNVARANSGGIERVLV